MSSKTSLAVLLGLMMIVGACNKLFSGDDEEARERSVADEIIARDCIPRDAYDGMTGCWPGGEIIDVRRVVDGDTLELADGRTVQLVGIDAPELDDCAGPAAAAHARSKVEGKSIKLHRVDGLDRDRNGHLLAYVQFDAPNFWTDLGYDLTWSGWAKPFSGNPGNPQYMSSLKEAAEFARYNHYGQFGPPCGKPGRPSGGDFDPDVDLPDRGLPDGALTGGFCRGKWWC